MSSAKIQSHIEPVSYTHLDVYKRQTNDPGATNDFWARLADGGMELHYIPGGHENILEEPNVSTLGKTVTGCLVNVDSCQGTAAVSLV